MKRNSSIVTHTNTCHTYTYGCVESQTTTTATAYLLMMKWISVRSESVEWKETPQTKTTTLNQQRESNELSTLKITIYKWACDLWQTFSRQLSITEKTTHENISLKINYYQIMQSNWITVKHQSKITFFQNKNRSYKSYKKRNPNQSTNQRVKSVIHLTCWIGRRLKLKKSSKSKKFTNFELKKNAYSSRRKTLAKFICTYIRNTAKREIKFHTRSCENVNTSVRFVLFRFVNVYVYECLFPIIYIKYTQTLCGTAAASLCTIYHNTHTAASNSTTLSKRNGLQFNRKAKRKQRRRIHLNRAKQ